MARLRWYVTPIWKTNSLAGIGLTNGPTSSPTPKSGKPFNWKSHLQGICQLDIKVDVICMSLVVQTTSRRLARKNWDASYVLQIRRDSFCQVMTEISSNRGACSATRCLQPVNATVYLLASKCYKGFDGILPTMVIDWVRGRGLNEMQVLWNELPTHPVMTHLLHVLKWQYP